MARISRSQFLDKLHALLEERFDETNLRWISNDAFEITSDDLKARRALSPSWDFQSLSSFIRQLSYYGFKRLSDRRRSGERRSSAASYIVFTHPAGHFIRGDSSRLHLIVRKIRIRTSTKAAAEPKSPSPSTSTHKPEVEVEPSSLRQSFIDHQHVHPQDSHQLPVSRGPPMLFRYYQYPSGPLAHPLDGRPDGTPMPWGQSGDLHRRDAHREHTEEGYLGRPVQDEEHRTSFSSVEYPNPHNYGDQSRHSTPETPSTSYASHDLKPTGLTGGYESVPYEPYNDETSRPQGSYLPPMASTFDLRSRPQFNPMSASTPFFHPATSQPLPRDQLPQLPRYLPPPDQRNPSRRYSPEPNQPNASWSARESWGGE